MEISVLMSVYIKERPEFLERALESIFNQTIKPKELVLVKDGVLTRELEMILNKERKKFEENFDKVSDEVKYRTDIPDKDKYINLIFNKFY